MAILYKKYQSGGTEGKIDPEERLRMREAINAPKTSIISSDMQDESDYLKQSYAALSSAFKTKYPNVDYGGVKSDIDAIDPNYRPEWRSRADQFSNKMRDDYGDYNLSREEMDTALRSAGLDSSEYGKRYGTMAQRLGETGTGIPHEGTKEYSSNWGWRNLSSPIYGVKKDEDRYQGLFK